VYLRKFSITLDLLRSTPVARLSYPAGRVRTRFDDFPNKVSITIGHGGKSGPDKVVVCVGKKVRTRIENRQASWSEVK
jgi:hypothetical protein